MGCVGPGRDDLVRDGFGATSPGTWGVMLLVHLACVPFVFFSSSSCRGLAPACDCGTPLTFHFTF